MNTGSEARAFNDVDWADGVLNRTNTVEFCIRCMPPRVSCLTAERDEKRCDW